MEENRSKEKNRMLEGGTTRADVPISAVLMTVTTVPIAFAGVPMHYAGRNGMAVTFAMNVGLWWLRGFAPMDYLWHGFDTEDASPILGDLR